MDTPRGIRDNNPFNLEDSGIPWLGLSPAQDDQPYLKFDSHIYGIRAGVRDIKTAQREGISTVSEFITKFAPPTENNTAAYIAAVCTECNVEPDQAVDFNQIMPQLVKAIIRHENGQQPYTDADISYAISLA